MMQYIIPEEILWYYNAGFISFLVACVLAIFLLKRKDSSPVAKTYIVGAVATLYFGGFTVGLNIIFPMCPCIVTWTSPIGLLGGWALIVLAVAYYWYDRQKFFDEQKPVSPNSEQVTIIKRKIVGYDYLNALKENIYRVQTGL